jgi:probable rRNA maturation factor
VRKSLPKTLLRQILVECYRIAPKKNLKRGFALEIRWVKSSEIKRLNQQFRKKNRATDVLSFHSDQPGILGSIVIDIDTAKIQAVQFDHSLQRELCELYIHGVFHLLGYDHIHRDDARVMKRYERRLEKFLDRLDHQRR